VLLHQKAGGGPYRPGQVVQEVLGARVGDFGVGLALGDPVVVGNVCKDGLTGLGVRVTKEQVGLLSVCGGHRVKAGCGAQPR
jgi:hypothetical protein